MLANKIQSNRVIGYPLQHTQSPLLHNTIYHLLNCHAEMSAHSTQDLVSTVQFIKNENIALTAVTMPYKEWVIPYLDDLSEEANELNVVNTIINRQGKLSGYNTDIEGLSFALRQINLSNQSILIIGAGGAAQTAAYFLRKNQCKLFWLNRTAIRVDSLIQKYGGNTLHNDQLNDVSIDIIIHATPVGMYPNNQCSPLPHYQFNKNQIVFDMVYNPMDTLLLKSAKQQGAATISGIDMFIGQGLKQIELWLNEPLDKLKLFDLLKTTLIQEQTVLL